MHHLATLCLIATVVAASGCATAIRGTTQRLTVETDPAGANCTLQTQGDEVIYSIADTPGATEVKRRSKPIAVTCTKPGHLTIAEQFPNIGGEAADSMEAQYQLAAAGLVASGAASATVGIGVAAVAGSVALVPLAFVALAAWPVAIVVDASSGSWYGYQPLLVFLLPPSTFPDSASLDKYFQDLDDKAITDGNDARRRHKTECWTHCAYWSKRLEEGIAQERTKIAGLRARATVDPGAVTHAAPDSAPNTAARAPDQSASSD